MPTHVSPKTSRSAANTKKKQRKEKGQNLIQLLYLDKEIKTKIKSEIDLNQEKQEETEKSGVMVVSL